MRVHRSSEFSFSRLEKSGRQAGVGMIEVMVALVIFSFAMLGLAGAQVAALKNQKTAHFRSAASQHASEMADRIRANLAEARTGGAYHHALTAYADGVGTVPQECKAATCTTAQVAARDIYDWRVNLARNMLGGWGEITGDPTTANKGFVIRVYYKELTKTDGIVDPNCRKDALDLPKDNDVRCFATVVMP